MQHIETVVDVNQSGIVTIALPANILPGKHHIFLVIDEAISEEDTQRVDHGPKLMQMAGQVSAFATIEDPVAWQQKQREEWQREDHDS